MASLERWEQGAHRRRQSSRHLSLMAREAMEGNPWWMAWRAMDAHLVAVRWFDRLCGTIGLKI